MIDERILSYSFSHFAYVNDK